jgi:hypothetical protein
MAGRWRQWWRSQATGSLPPAPARVESCRRLAEALRPGGTLVLDEIDVERFDEVAGRFRVKHDRRAD